MNTATPLGKLIDDLLREASQDGEQWTLFRDAAWQLQNYMHERQHYLVELSENTRLRSELARAVRDIKRLGTHTASIDGCHVCATVRSYGFDPEALREEVGAGEAAVRQ